MTDSLAIALGGLALFIFGLIQLSESLKNLASPHAAQWLINHTRSRLLCLLVGTLAAIIIGSSSATIILVIGLVRAGLMPLQRALILVLGANIGTTFTSVVFSLKLVDYSPLLLLLGLASKLLPAGHRWQIRGEVMRTIGLVLFGLFLIEQAAAPLKHDPGLVRLLQESDHPIRGVIAGTVFSGIIQSSSATMGIVIALAKQSILPLTLGLGIMMGAEIGTCLDTLVASIGRSVEARRVGLFQLIFNLFSVALWLPMIRFLEFLVTSCFAEISHQLAAAHVLLNLSSALIALGLLPLLVRLLEWLLPAPTVPRMQQTAIA